MTRMMRKHVAGLALAGCAALLGAGRAHAQQGDVAVVYRLLQGTELSVTPAGGSARPAQVGQRLHNNDVVATGRSTRAALRFSDDASVLRVNPSSTVRLTSASERGVVVRTLNLEFGEVWTRVTRHQGTTLRVQTQAGVAAVKGTEFVVRVDSQGVTTVLTLEGVVEFSNAAGRVDVPAGSKVVADSAQAPRAQPATAAELRGGAAAGEGEGEGGNTQGAWIEIQLRDATGQTRTMMLQVPADAIRERMGGRP